MQTTNSPTIPAAPFARSATIHLLDGTVREGKLLRFSPMAAELLLAPSSKPGAIDSIDCARVAMIAFAPRGPSATRPPKTTRLDVVLSTGANLTVDVIPEKKPSTGFYADAVGGRRGYFVFDHAVRTKKRVASLDVRTTLAYVAAAAATFTVG